MSEFHRGDVYYVYSNYSETGSEQWSGRPAAVVSADILNRFSPCVMVAYLTTNPKSNTATHVIVNATGRPSTAICEQITCVDKSRLSDFCGSLSKKELSAMDEALRIALGLRHTGAPKAEPEELPFPEEPEPVAEGAALKEISDLRMDLARAEASLETYRALCDNLLDRLGCVCASA